MREQPKRYHSFQFKSGVKVEVFWNYSMQKWTAWLTRNGGPPAYSRVIFAVAETKRLAVRDLSARIKQEKRC